MDTKITELFGIEHPVVLAPMGGVSGGVLAAAVTRSGGLGIIGCGYGNSDWIVDQWELARNQLEDDQRIGMGIITWSLSRQPELLDLILEQGADPIFLSFGDPSPFVKKIRNAGRRMVLQVSCVEEALLARTLGADVIVVQGTEAGGHGRYHRTLFSLLPAVVDLVSPTPVLAAGSISDGRGLAAALMLGADGILMGTRFAATTEALGSHARKSRMVNFSGDDTVRTRVFDIVRGLAWPADYTGRAIANKFVDIWHGQEQALNEQLKQQADQYAAASMVDDLDTVALFAGEGIDLIQDCQPASEIIATIVEEAKDLLSRCSR